MDESAMLIHSASDDRITRAASGMRPVRGMMLHQDKFYRFAPSTASYKVTGTGAGTFVYFYGTDESDQSCVVRVSGFRPYMYVSLASVPDTPTGALVVENLVNRLQASLLMISAYNSDDWAPDRQSFSDALLGRVRSTNRGTETEFYITEPTGACMPIVDHEIVYGRQIKGNGVNSGYRGMHATRFLKLYFYAPKFVSLCCALLHGRFAERGAIKQARALSVRVIRTDDEPEFASKDKKRAKSTLERKIEANLKSIRSGASSSSPLYVSPTPDFDETGDYFESSDSDEDDGIAAVQGPAQARNWDDLLDRIDDQLGDFSIHDTAVPDDIADDEEEEELPIDMELASALETVDDDLQKLHTTIDSLAADSMKAALEKLVLRRLRARATEMLAQYAPDNRPVGHWDVCEADIDFTLRLMIDCGFAPEEFVEIDMQKQLPRQPVGQFVNGVLVAQPVLDEKWRETRAQVEIRCDYRHLARSADEQLQNRAPKHLTVSLDCEMKTAADGGFCNAQNDEMIQCVFIIQDDHAVAMKRAAMPPPPGQFYFRSVSFVLGSVDCRAAPRHLCTERHILSFADERTMYRAMARFISLLDPHIVTGYNSNSFDMPYMQRRARVLDCEQEWSRAWSRSTSRYKRLTISQRTFQSTMAGKIEFSDVRAEGVLFIDVLHQLRKDPMVKLRNYSLNAVAQKFLKATKEDVAYSLINTYNETATGREKLRSYCEKDALLPLEIIHKRQIKIALTEMARINNCPIEVIINRGQQVRGKCALYNAGAKESPPQRFYTRTPAERQAEQDDTYDGGGVHQPTPGLYDKPVVTLDWESLYPSEQVTHNFCPSTLIQPDYDLTKDPHVMGCADPERELTMEERLRRAEAATYTVEDMITKQPYTEGIVNRPDGSPPLRFLRHTVCVGIAPKVQMGYLAHRKRTKEAQAAAEDDELEALLNQRQLAIKMLANSLYGLFGATCSFLYAPNIAAAITQRGRADLYQMTWIATSAFAEYGTEVLYGDTDSIFVLLRNVETIEEAAQIGLNMAAYITAHMRRTYTTDAPQYNILTLAFEKVFRRLLLLAKKRYAGLKYIYSKKTSKLTADPEEGVPVMSGLESKRRDVTLMIGETVEDIIALLLDYRYSSEQNLVRAREFVWQTLVRPLLDGSMNPYYLAITKQLRDLPDQYRARNPGRALPIHVQLAERLTVRAGGKDGVNAPRSGDRLAYVVERGSGPVSGRAEDPVYVLENNIPIDTSYYLDNHIKKTVLRIFGPICSSRQRIRTVTGDVITATAFGASKTQRARANDELASEFLFGHKNQYIDPVPAHERHVRPAIVPMAKERKQKKQALVRYRTTGTTATTIIAYETSAAKPLHTTVGKSAARCTKCKRVTAGLATGDVCAICRPSVIDTAAGAVQQTLCGMLRDISDLRQERDQLVTTCQTCMGCADAPQQITCKNSECQTFWVRRTNLASIDEVERRMATQFQLGLDQRRLVRVCEPVPSDHAYNPTATTEL